MGPILPDRCFFTGITVASQPIPPALVPLGRGFDIWDKLMGKNAYQMVINSISAEFDLRNIGRNGMFRYFRNRLHPPHPTHPTGWGIRKYFRALIPVPDSRLVSAVSFLHNQPAQYLDSGV